VYSTYCFVLADVFKFDPEFEANEEKYAQLRKELLDEDTDDGDSEESGSGSGSEDSEESDKGRSKLQQMDNFHNVNKLTI
jgi:pre-mRNA-splicing factor CWC22